MPDAFGRPDVPGYNPPPVRKLANRPKPTPVCPTERAALAIGDRQAAAKARALAETRRETRED